MTRKLLVAATAALVAAATPSLHLIGLPPRPGNTGRVAIADRPVAAAAAAAAAAIRFAQTLLACPASPAGRTEPTCGVLTEIDTAVQSVRADRVVVLLAAVVQPPPTGATGPSQRTAPSAAATGPAPGPTAGAAPVPLALRLELVRRRTGWAVLGGAR